ncbi:MAG: galactokinase [Candidatus Sericytochromatia bacterium]
MNIRQSIKEEFINKFKVEPLMVRSPARVNMIGEHTDYNEGFVLPASINKEIVLAISKNQDNNCNLYSYDLKDSFSFDINNLEKTDKLWSYYLMGVIEQLQKRNLKIQGFNCVFGGNIPMGAGLSSSAALECALTFALNELFNLNLSKIDIVKISQKAENEFVGVKCGIMDQFISVFGKKNHVLKLDCKTLNYEYYPFNFDNIEIVLFDTQVKHSLASSEYNTRRMECEKGVEVIKKYYPNTNSLRDVSLDTLNKYKDEMQEIIYKRCKYVISENLRLNYACNALENNDLETFGNLMYQTHEGLKNDYNVSCKELDILVDLVKNESDVLGARMMGGGFGGCTINLVKKESVRDISRQVSEQYNKLTGKNLEIYTGIIENGTSII